MKKILIFGSTGMIGHAVYSYLSALGKYNLISAAHKKKINEETCLLDVRKHEHVEKFLKTTRPDFVINCAGLLIEASEKHIEDAILINSLFPNMLSRLGLELNFKLIQISTDCVFSGKSGGYSEASIPDGSSAYARTKALGEINNNRDLTIRTSTVGPELIPDGAGLLTWFLKQQGEISGFSRAYWSGVTSLELAKVIDMLIDSNITGVYNFTSPRKISKYDLLLLFKKIWHKSDVQIKQNPDFITDKSICTIRDDFLYNVKGYEEMMIECRQWMMGNSQDYPHYFKPS